MFEPYYFILRQYDFMFGQYGFIFEQYDFMFEQYDFMFEQYDFHIAERTVNIREKTSGYHIDSKKQLTLQLYFCSSVQESSLHECTVFVALRAHKLPWRSHALANACGGNASRAGAQR